MTRNKVHATIKYKISRKETKDDLVSSPVTVIYSAMSPKRYKKRITLCIGNVTAGNTRQCLIPVAGFYSRELTATPMMASNEAERWELGRRLIEGYVSLCQIPQPPSLDS